MKDNNHMRDYSREELLALTPVRYLSDGFVDGKGKLKPELQNICATAAGTQLLEAQLSPQELAFTLEAIKQSLPLHSGSAAKRFQTAVEEALETVRGMIQQPNNPGLTKWINQCASSVKGPADIEAFLGHLVAVLRQYSVMVASQPP
jgi:hypothetical protein